MDNLTLLELYTVKSTCYNHEDMPYCPVLVAINDEIQSAHNGTNSGIHSSAEFANKAQSYIGAKYLLQVWSKDNKKIYEKPLKCKIHQ